MTKAAAEGLGLLENCNVEARLYKLLVYESGGHFKIHRDTEKEAGMFATLVGERGCSSERQPSGNLYWQPVALCLFFFIL
jgi:hypothetical protein